MAIWILCLTLYDSIFMLILCDDRMAPLAYTKYCIATNVLLTVNQEVYDVVVVSLGGCLIT